jgi:hypothetical protein
MRRFIYNTLHPEIYHGHDKRPPFFEGWYYKFIDAREDERYAVIPGIFLAEDPAANHAFVQVLNGTTGQATYHQYPAGDFWAHPERFDVRVGPNHFRADCFSLDIDDADLRISGELQFESRVPWPVTLNSPGIMGWYAWVPFMECYHGVVSMDHTVRGTLHIDGATVNFTGGRGYIEKDWGQNFPSAYIWQQTNHFETPGTSLSASVALIPFMGRTFPGFLVGFWHNGQLHRLTTYTGAVIESLRVSDDHVDWTVRGRTHRISMRSERKSGGLLKAPIRTEMHKRVDETMQSRVHVRFATLDGRVIFEGEGRNAALEVHGAIERLVSG